MNRTLVYCHPYDKLLNAAIKEAIVNIHNQSTDQQKVYDLYESQFNPVMTQKELRKFSNVRSPEGIKTENLDPLIVEMAREINNSD